MTLKNTEVEIESANRVLAIVRAAEKGDLNALQTVRGFLAKSPAVVDMFGNLADSALRAWKNLAAGENPVAREAIECKLASLEADVGGPNPSILEKLLAKRIVACWLQVHYLDLREAQGANHHRQLDRAQLRYLKAIRALSQVRRLAGPLVQVSFESR